MGIIMYCLYTSFDIDDIGKLVNQERFKGVVVSIPDIWCFI